MNCNMLQEAGIDYEYGVKRFSGDADVYDSLLGYYVEYDDFVIAEEALRTGDMSAFNMAISNMRGVSGNLCVNEVYEYTSSMCRKFRSGNMAGMDKDLERLKELYDRAVSGIKAFLDT